MGLFLDLGILARYRRRINRAHAKYGKMAWLIIYQADVRFRLELVERYGIEVDVEHQKRMKNDKELAPLTSR